MQISLWQNLIAPLLDFKSLMRLRNTCTYLRCIKIREIPPYYNLTNEIVSWFPHLWNLRLDNTDDKIRCLPLNVEKYINHEYVHHDVTYLPQNLRMLNAGNSCKITVFPISLTHLVIYFRHDICDIDYLVNLQICDASLFCGVKRFPPSVTHLNISYRNETDIQLPPNLTYLSACGYLCQHIDFPCTLTVLDIRGRNITDLRHLLILRELHVSERLPQLPPSCEIVYVYKMNIVDFSATQIRELHMEYNYKVAFPPQLRVLHMYDFCDTAKLKKILPTGCKLRCY
jgi:hypothetical protein